MMLNKNIQGFHAQHWQQAVHELTTAQTDYVLVTLLGTAGSTPRASGTKMVITAESIYDTVGGGHLEYKIIAHARELLLAGEPIQTLHHFPLGASLGQCCGGSVTALFEVMAQKILNVDIYGAGHVAQALVPLLGQLPVRVRWIDSRRDLFPASLPSNVTRIVDEEPQQQVAIAPSRTVFIILTHNHQLDFAVTERAIKRNDAQFIGVIGSQTKATRFQLRLQHKGYTVGQIQQMTCPVGLPNVTGKLPMEVAVSIAGQLIGLYQQHAVKPIRNGLQWQTLKSELQTTEA